MSSAFNILSASASGEAITAKEAGLAILYELTGGKFRRLMMLKKACGKKKTCVPAAKSGAFRDVKRYQKKQKQRGRPKGEVHHMPSKYAVKASSISPNASPAIWMRVAHHHQTASHNRGKRYNSANIYRNRQKDLLSRGRWCAAIQMDVDDIRSKSWGHKYEGSLTLLRIQLPRIIGTSCSF